jgi:hypothetical protein
MLVNDGNASQASWTGKPHAITAVVARRPCQEHTPFDLSPPVRNAYPYRSVRASISTYMLAACPFDQRHVFMLSGAKCPSRCSRRTSNCATCPVFACHAGRPAPYRDPPRLMAAHPRNTKPLGQSSVLGFPQSGDAPCTGAIVSANAHGLSLDHSCQHQPRNSADRASSAYSRRTSPEAVAAPSRPSCERTTGRRSSEPVRLAITIQGRRHRSALLACNPPVQYPHP